LYQSVYEPSRLNHPPLPGSPFGATKSIYPAGRERLYEGMRMAAVPWPTLNRRLDPFPHFWRARHGLESVAVFAFA
jgi:hypothetical protein